MVVLSGTAQKARKAASMLNPAVGNFTLGFHDFSYSIISDFKSRVHLAAWMVISTFPWTTFKKIPFVFTMQFTNFCDHWCVISLQSPGVKREVMVSSKDLHPNSKHPSLLWILISPMDFKALTVSDSGGNVAVGHWWTPVCRRSPFVWRNFQQRQNTWDHLNWILTALCKECEILCYNLLLCRRPAGSSPLKSQEEACHNR